MLSILPGEMPIFSVSYHFIFTENKHGIDKLIRIMKRKWRMLKHSHKKPKDGLG